MYAYIYFISITGSCDCCVDRIVHEAFSNTITIKLVVSVFFVLTYMLYTPVFHYRRLYL